MNTTKTENKRVTADEQAKRTFRVLMLAALILGFIDVLILANNWGVW